MILANAATAPALAGASVDEGCELPTHRPLRVDLEWEAFTGRVWRDRQPKAFSHADENAEGEPPRSKEAREAAKEAAEVAAQQCFASFEKEWAAALASSCVEQLWQVWNRWAEAFFLKWKGLGGLSWKERAQYLGRGTVRPPRGRRAVAPTARETNGEAATERQLRLLRQLRRLEDLVRRLEEHRALGGVGALPQEIRSRWAAARRCGDALHLGGEGWRLPAEAPAGPGFARDWYAKLRRRCDQVAEV